MKLDYDGSLGQAYLHLSETDIQELQTHDEVSTSDVFVKVDMESEEQAILDWDKENPTKIVGIHISKMLFDTFLEISKLPIGSGRSCVERIGNMLSLEILKEISQA